MTNVVWASRWLARLCLAISALLLLALVGVTVVEVVGRYVFNTPIPGRQDISQLLLALCIFFAFPVVTLRGDQIDVDLMDFAFGPKSAFWRDRLIELLMGGCLLTMSFWLLTRAEKALSRNLVSEVLDIPKYPLVYGITLFVAVTGAAVIGLSIGRIMRGATSLESTD